jgi:hypothetical protein
MVKKLNLGINDLDFYLEEHRLLYAHIKIFQKLLNLLMNENNQELFGMDTKGVVDFFGRYLHWHNYHSVMFMRHEH